MSAAKGELNIACVLGSAVCELQVDGKTIPIYYRDPTVVALGCLIAAVPFSGPMLDSILEYRGVGTLLQLLSKSTCEWTLGLTSNLITTLLSGSGGPDHRERCQEFADAFYRSGKCSIDRQK
jgi:hypothetical protein